MNQDISNQDILSNWQLLLIFSFQIQHGKEQVFQGLHANFWRFYADPCFRRAVTCSVESNTDNMNLSFPMGANNKIRLNGTNARNHVASLVKSTTSWQIARPRERVLRNKLRGQTFWITSHIHFKQSYLNFLTMGEGQILKTQMLFSIEQKFDSTVHFESYMIHFQSIEFKLWRHAHWDVMPIVMSCHL